MNGSPNSLGFSTGQNLASGTGISGNYGAGSYSSGFAGGSGGGCGTAGFGFDSTATYSFTTGTDTVTETVTGLNGSPASIVFTEETSDTSLYTVTSSNVGFPFAYDGLSYGATSSTSVTYGFSGLGTSTAVETITSSYGVETVTFTEESGSTTLYQISSETLTITSPTSAQANGDTVTYALTESGATVTALSETVTNGTYSKTISQTLDPTAVFTIGSGTVTETILAGNTAQTITFTADGSNYVVSSIATTVIPEGTATTALNVNSVDRAEFTISSGSVTAVSTIGATGTVSTASYGSTVTFSPLTNSTSLAGSFVEETVTSGSNSFFKVYFEASGSSIYTEVAHGSGTTVDLTGLATQLAKLPTANLAVL